MARVKKDEGKTLNSQDEKVTKKTTSKKSETKKPSADKTKAKKSDVDKAAIKKKVVKSEDSKKSVTSKKKEAAPSKVSKKKTAISSAKEKKPIKEAVVKEEKKKEATKEKAKKTTSKSVKVEQTKDKKKTVKTKKKKLTKRDKKKLIKEKEEELEKEREKNKNVIKIREALTVNFLAQELKIDAAEIIKKLMSAGILATLNQRLDFDTASLIADEYGYELKFVPIDEEEEEIEEDYGPEDIKSRSPIITIMGHVDHGKTSLLDVIRKSDVVSGEAGGITQHIGAYQVTTKYGTLTFLDTPGHEAFTAMRARGVQVTDIAVIVVAADDGAMPQTVEAINHAKAAGVPILVVINKMDVPGANPDKVLQDISNYGLVAEDWGGDTIVVKASAKEETGIDTLLEMLFLQAEMMELNAPFKGKAKGVVVEAKLDKQRGSVVTVLVNKGILKKGDAFIAGTAYGKVRLMVDDKNRHVKEASPSVPVEILGFDGVPESGDIFVVVKDEKEARNISANRKKALREERLSRKKHITLQDLHTRLEEGEVKELKVIIKTDVKGSVEALRDSLERMSNEEIKLNVIHSGAGAVTESDIMLASASDAIIISFGLAVDSYLKSIAERETVEIRTYDIIYEVIEDIRAAMEGLLEPDIAEVFMGRAEVRKIIKVPKIGVIAGSFILEGKV
ncbi:translation initiation factor IF-2, partial [bacterium]